MSIENRPYVGTWGMRDRTLVRYTPDCLVYINGYLHIPGCRACNGSIDFQKYITSVTVDPSINAVANATISMSIPAHASEAFTGDGNYLLKTGLFVTVYFRGYFAMSGVAGQGEDTSEDFDPTKVPVYPYYQAFRGVVTEVSHEYNGGMYSVSMSCSDFLHFWSNLKVATNGSLFGPRPSNSNVQVYLSGHRFTNASPYSIIYSLFRIGFGSAGGVEFTMGRRTNIASVSDFSGETLSKMAGLNQERLFNSRNVNLRMYGMDGTLYNAFTQAYLGAFGRSEDDGVAEAALSAASSIHAPADRTPFETTTEMKVNARALGFNPISTIAAVGTPSASNAATINVLQMAAFTKDITQQGQVNQFETDYMTKLEIANAVCDVTGFEFYQDVDGDIVFKPAFYNLDTRSDPVFVIADRDLISLSESDREPEATYIKGTGSHFQNTSGTGLEGWLGVAAMYADYRLIADFGWRESTFETAYLTSAMAIYTSCINRLDIVNAGRRSANITIPLRPELRPGYPVYIENSGCFYYVESLSHSFQFGGQCTTQITGTAKRAKFHAPGNSGGPITLDNIQLDNPYLPACPLSSPGGDEGPPRYIGFPNVVLALDPDYLNPKTMLNVVHADSVEQVFQVALSYGVIEFTGEGGVPSAAYDGEFVLRTSNDTTSQPFTKADLTTKWTDVQQALLNGTLNPQPNDTLGQIVAEIQRRQPDSSQEDLINYLVLLNDTKARVAPGMSLTGNYRYYSCSHPSKQHQGQKKISEDQTGDTPTVGEIPSPDEPELVAMFLDNNEEVNLDTGTPAGGIECTALDNEGGSASRVLQTSQISSVTFARVEINKILRMTRLDLAKGYGFNLQINPTMKNVLAMSLLSSASNTGPSEALTDRLKDKWEEIIEEVKLLASELTIPGVFNTTDSSTYTAALEVVAPGGNAEEGLIAALTSSSRPDPEIKTAEEWVGGDAATDRSGLRTASKIAGKALYEYVKKTFGACIWYLTNRRAAVETYFASSLADGGLANQSLVDDYGGVGVDYDPTGKNVDPLYRARDKFLNNVSDASATFGIEDGTMTRINASFENTEKQIVSTPIFPVSDKEGFEVYGSFAYGRGLTVSSYTALMQQAGSDGQVVSGTGDTTSLQTLLAVEKFLDVLRQEGKTPEEALAEAEQFGGALAAQDIENALAAEKLAIEDGKLVSTMPKRDASQISGQPSTSQDANQSTLASNAPVELANIDPGTSEICQCKGAEAMFFLQAFSGEYAKLDSNEAVQEFLEGEVMARALPWELSREAMAGQIRDVNYTSLGEKFQKMGSDYGALFSSTSDALNEASSQLEAAFSREAFNEAIQESADEFSTFTEDE